MDAVLAQVATAEVTVVINFIAILLVLFSPHGGLLWGLNLHQAGLPQHVAAAIDRPAALRSWGISVILVVLGVIGIALRGTYMTTHSITWAIPVEMVAVGWFVALSLVPASHGNNHLGKQLVYMEFLCLWATIGATLIAEQLMGRYHVPFIAPVLVTVFTLALHSVGLPFIGCHATNLSYMPAVKILFAVQLVAAAVVYAAVTLGMTPEGLEERVGQMQILLTNHSAQLGDITATQANHSAQLGDITATQANHSAQLGDITATQTNHSAQLGDITALLVAIIRHLNISTSG